MEKPQTDPEWEPPLKYVEHHYQIQNKIFKMQISPNELVSYQEWNYLYLIQENNIFGKN